MPGYLLDKEKLTEMLYLAGDKLLATCPCCKNPALLYVNPVYEFRSGEEIKMIGNQVNSFKCYFCKLEINNYKELDYLKIPGIGLNSVSKLEKCARCGSLFNDDGRGTSLCDNCEDFYATES
jgi:hypothetical protein